MFLNGISKKALLTSSISHTQPEILNQITVEDTAQKVDILGTMYSA